MMPSTEKFVLVVVRIIIGWIGRQIINVTREVIKNLLGLRFILAMMRFNNGKVKEDM